MSHIYNDLLPDEEVIAKVISMKGIPPNSNPFHHDAFSMGTELVRGWMAMHEGFDNKDEPRALKELILVNTRSGQRLLVKFEPAVQTRREIIPMLKNDEFSEENIILHHHIREEACGTLTSSPVSHQRPTMLSCPERFYVYTGKSLVRLDIFINEATYRAAEEKTWLDPLENYTEVKARLLDWVFDNMCHFRESEVTPNYEPLRTLGWGFEQIVEFIGNHPVAQEEQDA